MEGVDCTGVNVLLNLDIDENLVLSILENYDVLICEKIQIHPRKSGCGYCVFRRDVRYDRKYSCFHEDGVEYVLEMIPPCKLTNKTIIISYRDLKLNSFLSLYIARNFDKSMRP